MSKKIKFKFKDLEEIDKVLVWVDYIDREFFNEDYSENWTYNGVYFDIMTYNKTKKGYLTLDYEGKRLKGFTLYFGLKENNFIIEKNEVKIFKDLENIVYNIKKQTLLEYLQKDDIKNKMYYIIEFKPRELEFYTSCYKLNYDSIDEEYFKAGNMFNSNEETEKYINKLNNREITLKEIKKERQEFFKDYDFE